MLKASQENQQKNSLFLDFFTLLLSVLGVFFSVANFDSKIAFAVIISSFFTFTLAKIKRNIAYFAPLILTAVFLIIFHKSLKSGLLFLTNSIINSYGEKTLTIVKLFKTQSENLIYINILIILILTLIFYFVIRFKGIWFYDFSLLSISAFGLFFNTIKPLGIVLLIVSLVILKIKDNLPEINIKFAVKTLIATVLIVAIIANIPQINFSFISTSLANKVIFYENTLPNGDFNNLKPYKPTNKTTLKIKMSTPKTMYLKGFVGDNFKDNKWQSLDNKTLYKYSDLFNSLYKNGFYSQTQIANKKYARNRITISNFGACKKFKYIPYSLCDNTALNSSKINDKNALNNAFDSSDYSYYASNIDFSKLKPNLTNEEKHYRDFVYKNYTSIDKNHKDLIKDLIGEYNPKGNMHYSYKNAKKEISEIFKDFKYDESATNCNSFADCVSNFANSKRGFSVHYASLCALVFRYLGIPARYVEGYIITKNDIKKSEIVLSEKNCHAWVEYYHDGIGWLPFETTPKISEKINLPTDFSIKTQKTNDEKIVKNKVINKKTKTAVNYTKNGKSHNISYVYYIVISLLIIILILLLKRKKKSDYFEKTIANLNKKGVKTDGYIIPNNIENFEKAQQIYFKKRFSNKSISLKDELFLKEFYKKTKKQVK